MRHYLWKYALKHFGVTVALLLCIMLCLVACGEGPSSGNTAEEMFREVITRPIPSDVSDLQGVGDTWQGYQLFLRFHATPAFTEQLLTGYEAVACDEILNRFTLPNEQYDQFIPGWLPTTVAQPECYQTAQPVQNNWTHAGDHVLLLDRQTGMVYFVGIGA